MKKSTLYMIICGSIGILYGTLHATKTFKRTLSIENTSQYPITLVNRDGATIATVGAQQTSDVSLGLDTVSVRARINNQDITTNAARDASDISWKINIDSNTQQINITKTTQESEATYNPPPTRNTKNGNLPS